VHRLKDSGLLATVRTDESGGVIRLGPLAHGAVWLALESFLGRAMPEVAKST
jgi:hypothetical protein